MQQRYFGGVVQPLGAPGADEAALANSFIQARHGVDQQMEALAFHRALEVLWRAIDQANKYVTVSSPFTLAKDPATKPRAGAVLHHLVEALFVSAVLLRPFMPETTDKILGMLDLPADAALAPDYAWGTGVPEGHVTRTPEMLFPRIET
jgi:methionyl-tRNA synthetase